MEEVWSSILHSSTAREATVWSPPDVFLGPFADSLRLAAHTLGGVVAGEGSFYQVRRVPPYADGTTRRRFVFALEMTERDAPLVMGLRTLLQAGSSTRRSRVGRNEQPTIDVRITSNRQHLRTTLPFMDRFLLPGAKRVQ